MFKLVVLFSVAALAAANPSGWLGHGAVVPGVTSVSAYDTRIIHPSPVYHHAPLVHAPLLYGNLYNHHLHKRSLGIAPLAYSSIVSHAPAYNLWGAGYGYGTRYGYGSHHYGVPLLASTHGHGYSNAILHPY